MMGPGGLVGFGGRGRLPQIQLLDSFQDGNDASFYEIDVDLGAEAADRHIIAIISGGANSGTITLDDAEFDGVNGTNVVGQSGKVCNVISRMLKPTGSSTTFTVDFSGTVSGIAAAFYQVWDLQPTPIIDTATVTAHDAAISIDVYQGGALFMAAGGDNAFSISTGTSIASQDGSDVHKRVSSKLDFTTGFEVLSITHTATVNPFALAAMSIR